MKEREKCKNRAITSEARMAKLTAANQKPLIL